MGENAPKKSNAGTPKKKGAWQKLVGFAEAVMQQLEERRVLGAVLVFVLDAVFTAVIVKKVPYTEIDWVAYMEEVEGVMGGEYDYSKLKGQTGPLVYPGGFVWIFAVLRHLTDHGSDIAKAQLIFYGIYLLNLAIVLCIYVRAKLTPAWALALLMMSKRVHSIFVLRMFNDGVAMLLLHAALLLFSSRRWWVGCTLFSLAVSVKMNVMLFSFPLLYLLLADVGISGAVLHIAWCALIQLAAGLPFLAHFPLQYIRGSFDLGRVFLHRWSVNLKFLPEDIFVSKPLAISLLVLHLLCLGLFLRLFLPNPLSLAPSRRDALLSPRFIVLAMFVGNLIGIVFARSMHFQFYAWYFHSLPALLWASNLQIGVRLGLFVLVEAAFNITDPAGCNTDPKGPDCGSPLPAGATLLCFAHLILLLGLFNASVFPHPYSASKKKAA